MFENYQTKFKVTSFPKISMVEKGEKMADDFKVANVICNFLENATCSLGITTNNHYNQNYSFRNPVKTAFEKLAQYPINTRCFHFLPTDQQSMRLFQWTFYFSGHFVGQQALKG